MKKLEKPKKLAAETKKYWAEITTSQYHFDRGIKCCCAVEDYFILASYLADEVEVKCLMKLTKAEILKFYSVSYDVVKRSFQRK